MDKPVCDVCTCDEYMVKCDDENLPEPARWKALDEKWTVLEIYANDELTKLEKGAFNGLKVAYFYLRENSKLVTIEAGTFDGVTVQQLIIQNNPKLIGFKANVFSGLKVTDTLSITCNPKVTTLATNTFDGADLIARIKYGDSRCQRKCAAEQDGFCHSGLTKIEKDAFRGAESVKEVTIQYNHKWTAVEAGAFNGLAISSYLTMNNNDGMTTFPAKMFAGLVTKDL